MCVDTASDLENVEQSLDGNDFRLISRESAETAVETLQSDPIDCVVTGHDLPDNDGLAVIAAVREHQPSTPAVLLGSIPPAEVATDTFESVVVEYLNRTNTDALDSLSFIIKDLITHNAHAGFPVPEDEDARLEALHRYADDALPLEDSFDRITRLIANHFDVSVAFIGLIDRSTEELVSCMGADWTQLRREDTICTHSMLQEDVLVVEDVADDPRFAANDTLDDLDIVSYAGANLTTPEGDTIGQLCLIDHEPRGYSESEQADLQEFAALTMELLSLRHRTGSGDSPTLSHEEGGEAPDA